MMVLKWLWKMLEIGDAQREGESAADYRDRMAAKYPQQGWKLSYNGREAYPRFDKFGRDWSE